VVADPAAQWVLCGGQLFWLWGHLQVAVLPEALMLQPWQVDVR
jgi:hypothetical protein